MNQFKMSLFLPPISPVKDSATGRTVQPPTLTPYKEITLQEVYKLITSSERLKTLTETVRRAAENGDEKAYRMLKQQTLPYVTPCGVFSYRKSDSLTGPSGLIVVDIDHLDSREEAEKLKRQLFDDLIHDITAEYKMTTIINTHDMNSVMNIGENIIFIKEGVKEWQGNSKEVITSKNKALNDFIFASDLFRKVKEVEEEELKEEELKAK